MPEPSALLQALGIIGVAAVLLWFALGTQLNIRKAGRAMRWLQSGLPALGPRTTLRWLGSSVAELRIVEPRAPFRAAVAMIVLEPRDLSALWALSRGRGRRDFLLLRLDLVRAPRVRADLIDPRAWTARDRRSDDAPFDRQDTWTDGAGAAVAVRHDGAADVSQLEAFWDRLARESGGTWRISIRPLVPHVEVHVLFPAFETDARALLGTVRELAEAVAAPR
jgi:hypothetical protein